MMHDPSVFDQPFDFIPERYLTDDGKINMSIPDADMAAFGHGRRYVWARVVQLSGLTSIAWQYLPRASFQQRRAILDGCLAPRDV